MTQEEIKRSINKYIKDTETFIRTLQDKQDESSDKEKEIKEI